MLVCYAVISLRNAFWLAIFNSIEVAALLRRKRFVIAFLHFGRRAWLSSAAIRCPCGAVYGDTVGSPYMAEGFCVCMYVCMYV